MKSALLFSYSRRKTRSTKRVMKHAATVCLSNNWQKMNFFTFNVKRWREDEVITGISQQTSWYYVGNARGSFVDRELWGAQGRHYARPKARTCIKSSSAPDWFDHAKADDDKNGHLSWTGNNCIDQWKNTANRAKLLSHSHLKSGSDWNRLLPNCITVIYGQLHCIAFQASEHFPLTC